MKQESAKEEPVKQQYLVENSSNNIISETVENKDSSALKNKPKGILRFDTNPPKVWEFVNHKEISETQRVNTKPNANKLRRRESDLNQKHR